MANTPDKSMPPETVERLNWKAFLESSPPGQPREVLAVGSAKGNSFFVLSTPPVQLFCDSEACDGIRYYDSISSEVPLVEKVLTNCFIQYRCRHCQRTSKLYAVVVCRESGTHNGRAVKLGEWPTFGPHIPSKIFSLLGEDQETFKKGRRAESQGMGVGAFAYYRRVVENQKNRLIHEIIKVSKRLGASPQIISTLEAARNETQFSKAVESIKDAIPDVLKINGQNPMTLLHAALSDGLHGQSDEECLTRATSIRLVMAEFAERISQALQDHAELNQAVSKLLQIKAVSGKPKPDSQRQSGTSSSAG